MYIRALHEKLEYRKEWRVKDGKYIRVENDLLFYLSTIPEA